MLKHHFVTIVLTLCALADCPKLYSQSLSASDLLQLSIKHHDPQGIWGKQPLELELTEKRPNGAVRTTKLLLDPASEVFRSRQVRDGQKFDIQISGKTVSIKVNGKSPKDSALISQYRLTNERQIMMRDYYTYLYGLPMKLTDPGTILHSEVSDTSFQGKEVLAVKVSYEETVGNDVWYFYFDMESYALSGYRFYHDESKNDGEYITLEGEAVKGHLRLPKNRKWYTHQGNKFLGEDIIEVIK